MKKMMFLMLCLLNSLSWGEPVWIFIENRLQVPAGGFEGDYTIRGLNPHFNVRAGKSGSFYYDHSVLLEYGNQGRNGVTSYSIGQDEYSKTFPFNPRIIVYNDHICITPGWSGVQAVYTTGAQKVSIVNMEQCSLCPTR